MELKIKAFIFDFDGVFTDGKVQYTSNGEKSKSYNIKDGMGLKILRENGIKYFLISGDHSMAVMRIAEHLKFEEIHIGVENKYLRLIEILERYKLSMNDILYMGDDINDLDIMREAGTIACPNDAIDDVRELVESQYGIVSDKCGGNGAVRDVIDKIIKMNKKYK
jgi:3-deoxy-D-manno-octulosonate 8-phosphate phosphatase (KDO 8-P phosphatase)